jgi:hypothetical protein
VACFVGKDAALLPRAGNACRKAGHARPEL